MRVRRVFTSVRHWAIRAMRLRTVVASFAVILVTGAFSSATPAEPQLQEIKALLSRHFPVKGPYNLDARDFQTLPLAARNEIAAEAARGMSLRTAGGAVITAAVPDQLVFAAPAQDTPAQAALRELRQSNGWRINVLRELSQHRLFSEDSVVGPLIEMLNYPGQKTNIPSDAMRILKDLTRIDFGAHAFEWPGRVSDTVRQQVIDAWRAWLRRNHDKRPVFDQEIEELLKVRIAAIELHLRRDLADYPPVSDLDPDGIRIADKDPLAWIRVDPRQGSAVRLMKKAPLVWASDQDYITVDIHAGFLTPPRLSGASTQPVSVAQSPSQVLREVLPGTDVAIRVSAFSTDPEFAKKMAASMKGLDSTPSTATEAKAQLETLRHSEITRLTQSMKSARTGAEAAEVARGLVVIHFESPIIDALGSPDRSIRRAAIMALSDERVGEPAVRALTALLKDGDPEIRRLAAFALRRASGAPTVAEPALAAAARDESIAIRVAALEALTAQKLAVTTVVPTLVTGLSDDASAVRQAAVRGLADVCRFEWQADSIVFPALTRVLSDPDERTRLTAIWATGELLDVRLRGWFAGGVQDASAARAFAPRAKALIPIFIQMLSETSVSVRRAAVRGLGEVGAFDPETDAKTAVALMQGLTDTDKEVRGWAVRGLGKLGRAAAGAQQALRKIAADPGNDDQFQRSAASEADRIWADVYREKLEDMLIERRVRTTSLAAPVSKGVTTQWADASSALPGIIGQPVTRKKATYRARVNMPEGRDVDLEFLAFTTQRGKVWIGWEMDFYVETGSTILGGMLLPGGTVLWHMSLASEPASGDIDALIREFDTRVSQLKVKGESDQRTSLGNADRTHFFTIPGTGQPVLAHFVSVAVEGRQARLVLENRETGLTRTFWIDLDSRQVLKVE